MDRDRISTKNKQKKKKQERKTLYKGYELISIWLSEISIWFPINQQESWLPKIGNVPMWNRLVLSL